jgi:hypothetical protein
MATAAGRRARGLSIGLALTAAAVIALAASGRVAAEAPTRSDVPTVDVGRVQPEVVTSPGLSAEPARAAELAPPGPPDLARLLAIADEVSADGRYVRIGDVEISASPVVSRGG